MKKACTYLKKIRFSGFMACLILFNLSCGLDTYIVMDDPVVTVQVPEYTNIQFNESYFEFWTKEREYTDLMFKGTDVYYKIYSNYSTMLTERANLESLASDDDTAAKAPGKLMDSVSSGGYEFKPLKASNCNDSPIIAAKGEDQLVRIRLTDYQNIDDYASKITVDGKYLNNSEVPTRPLRNLEQLSFNFGRTGTQDLKPTSEDEDVKYSTESEEGKWYISMFAVAVGMDVSYTYHYSNIVYLGAVTIDANSVDN